MDHAALEMEKGSAMGTMGWRCMVTYKLGARCDFSCRDR